MVNGARLTRDEVPQAGEMVIQSPDGRTLQQLPMVRVINWQKSCERTRNPGPVTCLDIHLAFPDGTRELRVRCNAERTVDDLSSALEVRFWRQAPSPREFSCGRGRAPLRVYSTAFTAEYTRECL